jgi:hypothetical protein
VSDTADAWLEEILEVVVRDSDGRPIVGEVVRFASVPYDFAPGRLATWVGEKRGGDGAALHAVKTNSRGVARAAVRLGPLAGEARVRVTVPALGAELFASYEVEPGAVHRLQLPSEMVISPGQRYVPAVMAVDRHGNQRTDPVEFRAGWPGVRVVGGEVAAGEGYGRGHLIASWGELTDTLRVTVVPAGRIAAVLADVGALQKELVAQRSDGTERRVITAGRHLAWPSWSPLDSTLVFSFGPLHFIKHLHLTDVSGSIRRLISMDLGLDEETEPRFGADGAWIYFTAAPPALQGGALWRVRTDGSEVERLSSDPTGYYPGDYSPSPSPDGQQITYVSYHEGDKGPRVSIRALATGTPRSLDIPGETPRWSPDGEWIAYITTEQYPQGEIRRMRPDGSDDQPVSGKNQRYGGGLDWSPDGEWIIAHSLDRRILEVIHVATGLTLILPNTKDLIQPSWAP